MHSKPPARSQSLEPDARQQQLEAFVDAALARQANVRPDTVLLLARSPESPAAKAVLALSQSLAARGHGGRLVFACSHAMTAGDVWQLSFDAGFAHETRLLPDPRVLGAHEQLIVGDAAVWYGDSMRRDPAKRDAFQSFVDDPAGAIAARRVFARLWLTATPLYGHAGKAAVALPAVAPSGTLPAEIASAEVAATLATWQPSTRH